MLETGSSVSATPLPVIPTTPRDGGSNALSQRRHTDYPWLWRHRSDHYPRPAARQYRRTGGHYLHGSFPQRPSQQDRWFSTVTLQVPSRPSRLGSPDEAVHRLPHPSLLAAPRWIQLAERGFAEGAEGGSVARRISCAHS